MDDIASLNKSLWLLFLVLTAAFLLAFVLFFRMGKWLTEPTISKSPFCNKPLRPVQDLMYPYIEEIVRYQQERLPVENKLLDLTKAAVCPETGRIFPNCVAPNGSIHLPKDYMRYSWQPIPHTDLEFPTVRVP